MSDFSSDILHNILCRLPAKDLLRFKTVCKLWKLIIDDPLFIKSHTKHQHSFPADILIRDSYAGRMFSLPLDRLNYAAADGIQKIGLIPMKKLLHRGLPLVGPLPALSCNGLILLTNDDLKRKWAIWNPLFQDFHEIPPPPPVTDPRSKYAYHTSLARSGFGYDEASDDYKVVRVDKLNRGTPHECYRSMIYTLKSRRWRAMEGFFDGCCGIGGVYLNGALHWKSEHGIVAFDLGREGVRELIAVPTPPKPIMGSRCWESLDALDGCLILSYGHPNYEGMDVYVMDSKSYETDKAWTKLLSVSKWNWCSSSRHLSIVAYLKSKGQVFLHHGDSGLIWLDLENKCSKEIRVCGFNYILLSFDQYSPRSLVRLDTCKRRKRKRKREKEEAHVEFRRKVSVNCVSSKFII